MQSKSRPRVRALARFVALCLCILVAGSSLAQTELVFDGVIIDRPNAWDSYATHLYVDGVHQLWHCSTSADSRDQILRSTNSQSLRSPNWSEPVAVLDRDDVPWAENHVCDPTVILGDFDYQSSPFTHALYFTADAGAGGPGIDNSVGAAFSNDGLNWTVHPTAIITTENAFNGTYGAGASTVAWGPDTTDLIQIFRDTTVDGNFFGRHRYKSSANGLDFGPTPGLTTQLTEEGHQGNSGIEADVAYNPIDGYWYAVISSTSFNPDFNAIRILRSWSRSDLFSDWELLADIVPSFVGQPRLTNPALARTERSTLLVDEDGWGYVFLGVGPENVFEWGLAQVRFRVFESAGEVRGDRFEGIGQTREDGDGLDGTVASYGTTRWDADPGLVFDAGALKVDQQDGNHIGSLDLGGTPTEPITIEGEIDRTGSGWVGVGFSTGPRSGLFAGELWAILFGDQDRIQVWADGLTHELANMVIPNLVAEANLLRLHYDPATREAYVLVNGLRIPEDDPWDLDDLGFVPSIQFGEVHFNGPTALVPSIDDFWIRRPSAIFADGFESGDLARWDSVCNGGAC